MVLSNAGEDAAQSFAERLQQTLAAVCTNGQPMQVSYGLALFPRDGEDVQVLVRLADQRLYHYKMARGR